MKLNYKERLVASIKWFILFFGLVFFLRSWAGGTEPELFKVGVLALPALYGYYRILFSCIEDFYEALRFQIWPESLSALFGEFWQDIRAEFKLFVLFGLYSLTALAVIQIYKSSGHGI